MFNKNKIFIILAIVILFFFLYYIFSVRTVVLKEPIEQKQTDNTAILKKLNTQEKIELKNSYNSKIGNILFQYEENLEKFRKTENDNNNFYENFNALRLEALNLIVPKEHRGTHLKIALIFSKINEICAKDNGEESFVLINELLIQAVNLKNNLKNL